MLSTYHSARSSHPTIFQNCGHRAFFGGKMLDIWCNFASQKNKPKEYPNSNGMMGRFLRTGFVWVRGVNNSRNFSPQQKSGR